MKKIEEDKLIESIESGEWKSVANLDEEKENLNRYAMEQLKKDARINIRLSSKTLELIRLRAAEEGMPYQTLISSIIHKYANRIS